VKSMYATPVLAQARTELGQGAPASVAMVK
jgi:hypothetical protein